jgi:hypothetical protein
MNMSAQPGKNCELRIVALEPHCGMREMQLAYAAFSRGGDEFYKNWWDFQRDVRTGHIIPVIVTWGDRWAQFGVELLKDDDGPYVSLLYYAGHFDRGMVWMVAAWIYQCLQRYKLQHGMGRYDEAFCLIVGRPAWRRILKGIGLEMDEKGFVSDQQGVLSHGIFGWQ